MKKSDLIDLVWSSNPDLSKEQIEGVVDGLLDNIRSLLVAGEEVVLEGFGTLKVIDVVGRQEIVFLASAALGKAVCI